MAHASVASEPPRKVLDDQSSLCTSCSAGDMFHRGFHLFAAWFQVFRRLQQLEMDPQAIERISQFVRHGGGPGDAFTFAPPARLPPVLGYIVEDQLAKGRCRCFKPPS